LLAPLTNHHSVLSRELSTALFDLDYVVALSLDSITEFFYHRINKFIVEVDFLFQFLNVDRLQKVTFFTILLVSELSIF
jgi:hypothetical protein